MKPPRLWKLDPHSEGKHRLLRAYLNGWLPVLGRWSGRILFIDGFAGPGEYEGGEEGSPLIALRAFTEHFARKLIRAEVVFFFVEEDDSRFIHLEALIEAKRPRLPANCHVHLMHGKFDETLTELLDAVEQPNARLAPCLVMADPFGISDTPMSIMRRILSNERAEVLVSFMYEAINRFKDTPEFGRHLDGLFGTRRWRDGLGITVPEKRKDFFYELYADQLRAAGARYVIRFELYERNRLVYAIFFGTKNSKGADLMKQAIWNVDPSGNFAFRGTRSPQLPLSASPDFIPLREALTAEFAGKGWVRIEEAEEFVRSDRTDYHSGHLKGGALKPMESSREIEVDPKSRRRRGTFPPGTRIRFG